MPRYEYKVVPAPTKGPRVRGASTMQDRFAVALSEVMNRLAVEGWEYLRTDTLPCEERSLTSRTTVFQNMLVFRREIVEDDQLFAPRLLESHDEEAFGVAFKGEAPLGVNLLRKRAARLKSEQERSRLAAE